jgi:hypothetical protein
MKKVKGIYYGKSEDLEQAYDSDDDFSDHVFVQGEKIDYL